MSQKSNVGVFAFSLVLAAGFVAFVVGSGKSHSLQQMAAHTQLGARPVADTSYAPETNLRLLEERPATGYATDALLRPGLEIEDGTAFLKASK